MLRRFVTLIALTFACISSLGCEQNWHDKAGWKARDFFDDQGVIELCEAIKANDLEAINRLAGNGVDINTKGKGNMTPLLWALPGDNFVSFQRLLELGADPNVVFDHNVVGPRIFHPNGSVTYMVCLTSRDKYFDAVFDHGGDPNLLGGAIRESPISALVSGYAAHREQKIKKLIRLGADIDRTGPGGMTAVQSAVALGHYDVALMLLEAGANHKKRGPVGVSRLIHSVIRKEEVTKTYPKEIQKEYSHLLKWLEDKGESVVEAKKDLARWKTWLDTYPREKVKMLFAQEIADRKAREKEFDDEQELRVK